MKIAIIAGDSFFKTSAYYITKLIAAHNHPNKPNFILFDKTPNTQHHLSIPTIIAKHPLQGILPEKILQQSQLVKLLKKQNIQKVIVFDEQDFIKTTIPQVLIKNSLIADEKHTKQITNCTQVITFLQKLPEAYLAKQTITFPVIQNSEKPFTVEEKAAARQEFADGTPYFVLADFITTKDVFFNALKAFSVFKKMQQSSWRLVLLLRSKLSTKEKEMILQPLAGFKYRKDVSIINEENEQVVLKAIAGSYALISMDENAGGYPHTIEAMATAIPVIAAPLGIMEPYKDAALAAENNKPESIAAQMMYLYKSETLRSRLSTKATALSNKLNTEKPLQTLIELLLQP
ncbi:MAG: hypothetical protein ACK5NK_05100 [Niabella sp.]